MFTKQNIMLRSNQKGFTIVELLVVIAIIGILASIVLVSLNSARERSRDARRIGDLNQVRTALELFANDNNGNYPADGGYPADLTSGGYMSTVPTDPSTGSNYSYDQCGGGNEFGLMATLENANAPELDNDATSACSLTCTDPNYCVSP